MIQTEKRSAAPLQLRLRRLLAAAGLAALLLGMSHYLLAAYRVADGLTRPFHGFEPGETPATYQIAFQDVRFPARGGDLRIAGWYMPRDGSRRAVVLVHGKSVNRWIEFGGGFLKLAVALHARGFTVLMIDLRAHGESEGERAGFGLRERRDVIGAVDWLEQQGYAPGSVGVLGVSMGAVASIGAAADDPDIGALVADCGFADMGALLKRQWGAASGGLPDFYRPATIAIGWLLGYDFYADRPAAEIGRIAPRPVLIVHGDADALVPLSDAQQLRAAGPSSELWVVHGAGHGGSYRVDPKAYTERVAKFFEQHLAPKT
jgi:dipeptidyl aminopeptidase/acylaminoacyl peptidase